MSNIKISIVTVCYNAVDTIEETILSVLSQSYDNIEYIIIDGGSKDGTLDIIKQYEDKLTYWISEPDHGIYDAMNKGIMHATGDFINFMNAGDSFFDSSVVERVVRKIPVSLPTVVYGNTLEIYSNKQFLRRSLPSKYLRKKGILCHQSAFISTDYHRRNLYNLNYKILSDFNFFFRAYNYDNQSFLQLDDVISRFSMKDNGLSKSNYDDNYKEFIAIVSSNLNKIEVLALNVRRLLGKVKRRISN